MTAKIKKDVRDGIMILTLSLLTLFVKGQELSLNESTNFYEYSQIKDSSNKKLISLLKKRLENLNYNDVTIVENTLSGNGFTSHLVMAFATVEIKYVVKISFKEDRYKLTLTNFILTDKNGSNPLEGMGSFKKKWISIINKKLPEIIKNIESLNKDDNW